MKRFAYDYNENPTNVILAHTEYDVEKDEGLDPAVKLLCPTCFARKYRRDGT